MLEQLLVHNYALIDTLEVDFCAGLNCITGETGAGKSMFLGVLRFLRGEKANASVIRKGAQQASIQGVFTLSDEDIQLHKWLAKREISYDTQLCIRRVIRLNGKSTGYVQNIAITMTELKELGTFLFDVHGQHDQYSLFVVDNHRLFLDNFVENSNKIANFEHEFIKLSYIKKELVQFDAKMLEHHEYIEQLEQAVDDIRGANLSVGLEERMYNEIQKLSEYEQLVRSIDAGLHVLYANEKQLLTQIYNVLEHFKAVNQFTDDLQSFTNRMDTVYYEIDDIMQSVHSYRSQLYFSQQRLEECEQILYGIQQLKKRYKKNSVAELLEYADNGEKELLHIKDPISARAQLQENVTNQMAVVHALAQEISDIRQAGAKDMEAQVLAILASMGMQKTRFVISITERIENGQYIYDKTGMNVVEFLIASNTGELLMPLKSIASGGELSRVILAIKSILSYTDIIHTLLFDEIDTGIGGEIGTTVGAHMQRLAAQKQILCITHLASIAAYAHHHIVVYKMHYDDKTQVNLRIVTDEMRVDEIARMLGSSSNNNSRQYAQELLYESSCMKHDKMLY